MTGYRITARGRWALAVPGFLLVLAGIVVAELLAGQTGATPVRSAAPVTAVVHPAPGWPSAAATVAENARPGTAAWPLTDYTPGALDGWADHVSVHPGEPVQLYVSTGAASFTVQALRMGWYGGTRARLVWSTPQPIIGIVAADPTLSAPTRTISAAAWSPSLRVDTTGWLPGDYLFRLLGSDGHQSFVPLTVLSPTTAGAVVLVNAVTTWQAYNAWGGYSLYHGPGSLPEFERRSVVASFDRPYDFGGGAADFVGNELPVVALAEQLGLPVAYVTDVDLQTQPGLLANARAVISLGHDEYWSADMRDALSAARDAGTNLAFLGANAIYRHIRFDSSPIGPDRLEVNYKTGREDPSYDSDPAAATFDWRDGPDPRPESVLTGTFYQCNPVHTDMVVADPDSWLLAGTDAAAGDRLTGLVGSEFDRVDLRVRTPRPIEIIFHSPLRCGGSPTYADAAYYSTASGAGVFDVGTSSWVCAVDNSCGARRGDRTAQRVVRTVTTTVLTAFAKGPAGAEHPAVDNVDSVENLSNALPSELAVPTEPAVPSKLSAPSPDVATR